MPVKIHSYGGIVTWIIRKYCSNISSKVALYFADRCYRDIINEYIQYFLQGEENGKTPLFRVVNIETINRCNGKCEFCPANIYTEKRPLKKMTDETFKNIVKQLKELNFDGQIFLNINNEPLIDVNLIDRAKLLRETLGGAVHLSLITNATLLTEEKMDECGKYFDDICINNYSEYYKLLEHNRILYDYIKKNEEKFRECDVSIRRRYSKEILGTRAGNAPNKPKKNNKIDSPCIYVYTDISIYPDGTVGLCCNDCFEKTDFGNINNKSMKEIWEQKELCEIRRKMREGRTKYPFCVECDVADSGFREKLIRDELKSKVL